ncbi:S8 family serine peptidase (plasmid) [Metabacillus halosaccharovorans]|uniref:S8 family peptidase n=1 Tax=Metabacillus halosaccharovorans TaxID=930124 RepID=UPI00203A9FD9|nr:S8 family serine peptidase [Metabacillus halosaccharovorans]MCM3444134.1 S8 family serine peptidase [Metabacillus halosaccharovorans]
MFLSILGTTAIVYSLFSPIKAFAIEKEGNYSILLNDFNISLSVKDELKKTGAEIVYEVPEIGFLQVKATNSEFSDIKMLSQVSSANPSISWEIPESEKVKVKTNDISMGNAALWNKQWDIKRVTNNGASYKLGTGSHDVVVGIIDSGIDRDHPDLIKNLLPGSKNMVPAGGYQGIELDENGNSNAFDDKHGHGSHVAGSIAGNGAMLGVAPNIGIRSYRVFGTSSAESSWIYKAMITAANDGVDVISMSLGGYDVIGSIFYIDPITGEKQRLANDVADFKAYKRAVDYVTKKGSLVVVAAGNESLNATNKSEVIDFLNAEYATDGLFFVGAGFDVPGTIPGVITVSATGQNDILANYSNWGPGYIDIAAVGGDTRLYYQYLSEGRRQEYYTKELYQQELTLSTSADGGWYYSNGTSMATPKVSAVAALLIDKYGKMNPSELAKLLTTKAVDPVDGIDRKYFGAGHLNAYGALK